MFMKRKTNYEEYPPDNKAQVAYVIKEIKNES